jgi:hypothetical protein
MRAPGEHYDQLRPGGRTTNAVALVFARIDQDRPAVGAEEPWSGVLVDTAIPPVTAAAATASTKRNRRGPRRVVTGFAGTTITNSLSLLSTTLCGWKCAGTPGCDADDMDGRSLVHRQEAAVF